jgi:hypothetical protein
MAHRSFDASAAEPSAAAVVEEYGTAGENPVAMPDRGEMHARPAPASVTRIGLALILAV